MFNRNFIAVYILIISTVLINKCIREKTPAENDYHIYIESWADTLSACGYSMLNTDLEPAAQRSGAIRAASLNMFRIILDNVYILPISNAQTINDLIIESKEIQTQITLYYNDARVITEVNILESGDAEVCGYLPTDGIKTIILPYL
jgi:hypothetical protein